MSVNGQDTRADLEVKNKRLLGEIDQLQTQLFKANDQARALNDLLEEKKHSEQLAGWAIDRALQIRKENSTAETVIADAEKFCAWVHSSSAKPPTLSDQTIGNA